MFPSHLKVKMHLSCHKIHSSSSNVNHNKFLLSNNSNKHHNDLLKDQQQHCHHKIQKFSNHKQEEGLPLSLQAKLQIRVPNNNNNNNNNNLHQVSHEELLLFLQTKSLRMRTSSNPHQVSHGEQQQYHRYSSKQTHPSAPQLCPPVLENLQVVVSLDVLLLPFHRESRRSRLRQLVGVLHLYLVLRSRLGRNSLQQQRQRQRQQQQSPLHR